MQRWAVPEEFVAGKTPGRQRAWALSLPRIAADLAERWALRPDGPAWFGWVGVAWPALTADDRPVVLKISWREDGSEFEGRALTAWDGRGTVACHAFDQALNACLIDRLDADRDLNQAPIEDACRIIGLILRETSSVSAPGWAPRIAATTSAMLTGIEQRRGTAALPGQLVDAAVETLRTLTDAPTDDHRLLHHDMHFLNVLRTRDGAGWLAIDPSPLAGPPEWELTPLLRNRFDEALATGDPDRALGRRVDLVCDITGWNAEHVRRYSQAEAVTASLFLQQHQPDHMHAAAYLTMTAWVA